VNAADRDGDTCLHMILRLIAHGDAGKHPLVDMFNCVDIPLVCVFAVRALAVASVFHRHRIDKYLDTLLANQPAPNKH